MHTQKPCGTTLFAARKGTTTHPQSNNRVLLQRADPVRPTGKVLSARPLRGQYTVLPSLTHTRRQLSGSGLKTAFSSSVRLSYGQMVSPKGQFVKLKVENGKWTVGRTHPSVGALPPPLGEVAAGRRGWPLSHGNGRSYGRRPLSRFATAPPEGEPRVRRRWWVFTFFFDSSRRDTTSAPGGQLHVAAATLHVASLAERHTSHPQRGYLRP